MIKSAVEEILSAIAVLALLGLGLWCLGQLAGAELPEFWYMNIAY